LAQSSRALSEDAIINALRCQPGTVENAKGGCDPVAGAVAPVPSRERCGPLPDGSFGIKDPVQGCLKIKDAVGGFNVGGIAGFVDDHAAILPATRAGCRANL